MEPEDIGGQGKSKTEAKDTTFPTLQPPRCCSFSPQSSSAYGLTSKVQPFLTCSNYRGAFFSISLTLGSPHCYSLPHSHFQLNGPNTKLGSEYYSLLYLLTRLCFWFPVFPAVRKDTSLHTR